MKISPHWNLAPKLLLTSTLLAMLVTIAACNTAAQPDASSAAVQNNSSGVSSAALPAPMETVTNAVPSPTQIPPRKPLGAASPEGVGQAAIAFAYEERRVLSGTPQVLLARPITLEELGNLGLGWSSFGSIEQPPLMLVILKGDFSKAISFGGFQRSEPCLLIKDQPSSCPEPEHYHYIGYVYDLWAGMPTIYMQSKSGGIFKQALNDPSLPYEAPLSTPENRHTLPSGSNAFHYGDSPPGGEPAEGKLIREAGFGAGRYSAYIGINKHNDADGKPADPNRIYATLSWNWDSPSGGLDYVAANKKLMPQVAAQGGQVEVSVVFKDYVPVDQFRAFVQKYGLKPGLSYLRAIDQKPVPVYAPYYTIKVSASNADPIPQASLDSQFASLKNDPQKQVALKGVYATHAWLDAKQLQALTADPSVYYVDVAVNAVRSDLAKAGVAGAAQAQVVTYSQLVFPLLMEKPYQSR